MKRIELYPHILGTINYVSVFTVPSLVIRQDNVAKIQRSGLHSPLFFRQKRLHYRQISPYLRSTRSGKPLSPHGHTALLLENKSSVAHSEFACRPICVLWGRGLLSRFVGHGLPARGEGEVRCKPMLGTLAHAVTKYWKASKYVFTRFTGAKCLVSEYCLTR